MHLAVNSLLVLLQKDSARRKFQKAALIICEKGELQHGNDKIIILVTNQLSQHDNDQLLQQKMRKIHLLACNSLIS